ncbi:RICIN domain-containing protein [Streptomyces sp. YS415]|uniref:RICIN domain-containing protein n=1 Tax=Streptomyces sp. YS415 TaxID=2944806 RepID=UPI0020201B0A|nr:RICIN domain-containing protein [Streptomyces sp. YS415]MCL7429379.1 RICIN domain-containing protein [Streptomyces sp. YS415]
MKKYLSIALAAAGVATALSAMTTPATAAGSLSTIQNRATGKCLVTVWDAATGAHTVTQGTCSTFNAAALWEATAINGPVQRLRNVALNKCLDTGSGNPPIYLSSCSSQDQGQQWAVGNPADPDWDVIESQYHSWSLVGWLDGTVGLVQDHYPLLKTDKAEWNHSLFS